MWCVSTGGYINWGLIVILIVHANKHLKGFKAEYIMRNEYDGEHKHILGMNCSGMVLGQSLKNPGLVQVSLMLAIKRKTF